MKTYRGRSRGMWQCDHFPFQLCSTCTVSSLNSLVHQCYSCCSSAGVVSYDFTSRSAQALATALTIPWCRSWGGACHHCHSPPLSPCCWIQQWGKGRGTKRRKSKQQQHWPLKLQRHMKAGGWAWACGEELVSRALAGAPMCWDHDKGGVQLHMHRAHSQRGNGP